MRWVRLRLGYASDARRDKGAVATLFAVLLAGGVVIGMLALTVDIGGFWVERRELQNSADAASLSLASICAKKASDCDPLVTPASLNPLINANAGADQASQLLTDVSPTMTKGQCARTPTGLSFPNMPTCESVGSDAVPSQLSKCPAVPAWLRGAGAGIPFVEVYTQTEHNGSTVLPPAFSQALVGGPGSPMTVSACARAAWGPPGVRTGSVSITISSCEWNTMTNGGTSYVNSLPVGAFPGYGGSGQPPMPSASQEIVINLAIPNPPTPPNPDDFCQVNGKDTPGGFGYVSPTAPSTCVADITTDNWVNILNGNNATNACESALSSLYGKVIQIPVYDCILQSMSVPTGPPPTGPGACLGGPGAGGAKAYYHIAGWANFYLSGYKVGGGPASERVSVRTGSLPCTGSVRCLSGWYVKGSLDATSIAPPSPGNDFGAFTVLPAG
ncbi:putative Flp pilus-assembly TadE/G-like protein [Humibacillus xanthopallidus]|uniref:Putative Flp pilus-assembly TadE/G-like protein n=1 Tax=Humibacillus xanthopallidus TaxID=412689 RepID=A0A543PME3_9MICO|nr:putative Flp pilus-assembly TadE/G-like protein [Humibacillus xanthopallidus]